MEHFFTVLIPILAAAVVILVAKRIASHPFRCRHCSETFRIKWQRVLLAKHMEKEYLLACPHCKIKDWCTEQTDDAQ